MVSFKEITSEDSCEISALSSLADEIWREHYTSIIGAEQVEYMIEKFQSPAAIEKQLSEGYRYFLVADDAKPVGYFAVQPQADKLFLSKIYVARIARGCGVGKAMLEKVFSIAGEANVGCVYLTVNKNNKGSIEFYKRNGFEIVKSAVFDIGGGFVMDDYVMEKTLQKPAN